MKFDIDGVRAVAAMALVAVSSIVYVQCAAGCSPQGQPETQNIVISSSYAVALQACLLYDTAAEARACACGVAMKFNRPCPTKDAGGDR